MLLLCQYELDNYIWFEVNVIIVLPDDDGALGTETCRRNTGNICKE